MTILQRRILRDTEHLSLSLEFVSNCPDLIRAINVRKYITASYKAINYKKDDALRKEKLPEGVFCT